MWREKGGGRKGEAELTQSHGEGSFVQDGQQEAWERTMAFAFAYFFFFSLVHFSVVRMELGSNEV